MDEVVADYMSDDFITGCLGDSESDIRPGLLKNRKEQREHDLMKKKAAAAAQKKKPMEFYQAEALEKGLKEPIGATNKGFSMLQKMGFKDGMGLGKNSSGITEPIGITLKNNKKGLGLVLKAPIQKKHTENKRDLLSEKDFMAHHSRKDKERKILSDLKKSQRVCEELDLKTGKTMPDEIWFWPDESDTVQKLLDEKNDKDEKLTTLKENEVKEDLNNDIKLEILTKYLRGTYFYCIWCTVQYNDEEDLQECPGATRDDH